MKLACGRAVGDSVPASIGSDHPVRLFTRRRKTKSIMPIMSQILRRLGRWGVILALWCSLANGASAAEKDWLDEMPSVPAVIQAVREQVELTRQQNPALAKDEDFLAEDIVGTFVLLRWVMDMQSDKEWYTSEEWRKRMRGIEMGYMQVELAIGLGVGKRKGHIKDNCDHKDSYLNRLGQKMHATPVECYQYRFHVDLSNVYPSLNHRNAIFPLLFCDRARYYLDLVQEQVRKTPPPRRTPAQTLSLPDGVRPLGPAVCEHYGYDSDRNKNGLCDDWEKPLPKTALASAAGRPGCPARELVAAIPAPPLQCSTPTSFRQAVNDTCETADEAAQFALQQAWILTNGSGDDIEWGGLIYEVGPKDYRYVTPMRGDPPATPGGRAYVVVEKLKAEFAKVEKSARIAGKTIKPVAIYHTHPRNGHTANLSLSDINAPIIEGYQASYMRGVGGDTCGIHRYKNDRGDQVVELLPEGIRRTKKPDPHSPWYFPSIWRTGEEFQEIYDTRRINTTWIPLAAGHQPCPCDPLGECP